LAGQNIVVEVGLEQAVIRVGLKEEKKLPLRARGRVTVLVCQYASLGRSELVTGTVRMG